MVIEIVLEIQLHPFINSAKPVKMYPILLWGKTMVFKTNENTEKS